MSEAVNHLPQEKGRGRQVGRVRAEKVEGRETERPRSAAKALGGPCTLHNKARSPDTGTNSHVRSCGTECTSISWATVPVRLR